MARVELPQSKLRRRKRRRRIVVSVIASLLSVAVVGGAIWLSWAPFLRITSVEVEGSKTVASSTLEAYTKEKIRGAYVWLFARNNIFLYPRAGISQGLLDSYPSLRAADVHAKNFHTISVSVIEREPVALWCDESCFYLDETGLVYGQAPTYSSPIFVTYKGALASSTAVLPKQYLTQPQFQSLFALVGALAQKEPDDLVREVVVDSSGDVRAYFQNDFLLIWNIKDDGGDVFERFTLALESGPFSGKSISDFQYLDLRWGERLYYKAK